APVTQNIVRKKVSYKEKRAFETLKEEISNLEKEKVQVQAKLNSGNAGFEELQQLANRIGEITALLDEKEMKWLELSELMEGQ
ncbi:MAG: ABC transporter C-terminal domain-containing protein, partial [Flavitalea sp.]